MDNKLSILDEGRNTPGGELSTSRQAARQVAVDPRPESARRLR